MYNVKYIKKYKGKLLNVEIDGKLELKWNSLKGALLIALRLQECEYVCVCNVFNGFVP